MTQVVMYLQEAARCIEQGLHEQALQSLEDPSVVASPVRDGLRLVAQAALADRDGDVAAADAAYRAAHSLGVPLLAILQPCARHFARNGHFDLAYDAYSVLQNLCPGAIDEFLRQLPPAEMAKYSPWRVRRLLDRPGFYGLPPYKAALVERFGIDGAAIAYAQMAGLSGWIMQTLPLQGLRSFAQQNARAYRTLHAVRNVTYPPPPVFGENRYPALHVRTREFFACELEDAIVSSKSNFILVDGTALLDIQDDELQRIPVLLTTDPLLIAGGAEGVTAVVPDWNALPALPSALSLVGLHSHAFGHWIVEFLPKLLAWIDRDEFASVPILIDRQMPAQHVEVLRCLLGPDWPLVWLEPGTCRRVGRLLVASTPVYMPTGRQPGTSVPLENMGAYPEGLADLLKRGGARIGAPAATSGPRRLYLARKAGQHRRLVNHGEVERWARSRGFAVVDFAEHSFREQINLIRGADCLLGPEGSAFFAAFFARPGTRVGILNHEFLEDFAWYAQTFSELGIHLGILVGETVAVREDYAVFSDYRIELPALERFYASLFHPAPAGIGLSAPQ